MRSVMHKSKRTLAALMSIGIILTLFVSPVLAASQDETGASTDPQITLTTQYFPDATFREWLAKNKFADIGEGGILTPELLNQVTIISVPKENIGSVEGIQYFPNLNTLNVAENQLTTLDISRNTKLTWVWCNANPITSLTIGTQPSLSYLDCSRTNITSLDLSGTRALSELKVDVIATLQSVELPASSNMLKNLFCAHTGLTQLNTAASPLLERLDCEYGELASVDVSLSTSLVAFSAAGNRLVSVHGPNNGHSFPQREQRAYDAGVAPHGGTFDLSAIDSKFAQGQVTNVQGGTIVGSIVSDVTPGSIVTYDYADGGATASCSLRIVSGNEWISAPLIAGWTQGELPSVPSAQAKYGTPVFTYAPSGTDAFTATVPSALGSYVCRAVVAATPTYGELVGETTFEIAPAVPVVPPIDEITAVYRTPTKDIALPEGFAWASNVPTFPGNVGERILDATYTAPGTTGPALPCQITIRVVPMPGSECTISPITNSYESKHIVITAPDGYTLIKGLDYTVTSDVQDNRVDVIIHFVGNFSGTETRSFSFMIPNEWIVSLSIENWMQGATPSAPVAEAKYGEPAFSYEVNGTWQSDPPTQAGVYTCRAVVPATVYYPEIEAQVSFTIYAAIAPDVGDLSAVYRDTLADIPLPAGFSWINPQELVGDAGLQTHRALYSPQTRDNLYEGGETDLTVQVNPKDGALCEISPITNEYESKHITVRDGTYVLPKNEDYTVRSDVQDNEVFVYIDFESNYYGTVDRMFTFGFVNEWMEPLSIADWIVGENPSVPHAEALYGEPEFSYEVDGQWSATPPDHPGSYICRAIVPATVYYPQIEAETAFSVLERTVPDIPQITTLAAVYGDLLSDVALPDGFAWTNPKLSVGDVGTHNFEATYAPEPGVEAQTVMLTVKVTPKDGRLCTISPIDNQYNASHIVITDGTTTLVKGEDYDVSWRIDKSTVYITIQFKGNYMNSAERSFSLYQTNRWVVPLSISSWSYGQIPVTPIAEPLLGTATFSYLVNGQWQADPPTEVGSYEVRAEVPETEYYNGLVATLSFQILPESEQSDAPKLVATEESGVQIRTEAGNPRTLIGDGLTATRPTVRDVRAMLRAEPDSPDYRIWILNPENTPLADDAIVGTGCGAWLVDMAQGGRVLDQVTIVVYGDVLGNGTTNLSQLVRMAAAFRNPTVDGLSGPYLLAGDLDQTGQINLTDLVREASLYRAEQLGEEKQ